MLAALTNLVHNGADPEMTLQLETGRLEALKALAAESFGEITPAEEEVLRLSASVGGVGPPESGDRPEVRAAFLRWLATDRDAAAHIDPLGIRVANATVTSALDLKFCRIPFPLRFTGCTLQGEFYLRSAKLLALFLTDCKAEHGISADGLSAQGDVFLRGLEVKGELRFVSAQIGGDLDCSGAAFAAERKGLNADRANITGGVFLTEKFSSLGEIRFLGARIGGSLNCSGAKLAGREAFNADGAKISGDVFLGKEFSSSGTVRFPGAQIGGSLDFSGSTLTAEGNAVIADGAEITGDVFLREKFSSLGTIRLPGARIGGDLDCSGARIKVLICEHMRLKGNLIWTAIRDPKNSYLNLHGASVKVLHDDDASWLARGSLAVRGLEYGDLTRHEPSTEAHLNRNVLPPQRKLDAGERIRWLCLQSERNRLDPQPWMWLAKLFKEKGQDGDARWVLLSFRLRQAIAGSWLRLPHRVLSALLSWEPLLVLLFFIAFLVWGHQVYQRAWDQRLIRPTAADAFTEGAGRKSSAQAGQYAYGYPVFSPWIYALENELPLVKFGMDEKWAPDPNLVAGGRGKEYFSLARFRWFLILAGWVQGIALTFGINRRFHD